MRKALIVMTLCVMSAVAFAAQDDFSKYARLADPDWSGVPATYNTQGLKPRTDWPGGPSGADQWLYDNQRTGNAYYFYDAANVGGMMITPSYAPSIIVQLDIHVETNGDPYWPWPDGTNDPFEASVWFPTNRGDQYPGEQVFFTDEACATGTDTATVTIPIPIGSLICWGDTFWVCMSEITAGKTGMGLDNDGWNYPNRNIVRISDVWQYNCCSLGDKMIRAWTMQLAGHDFACTGITVPAATCDSGMSVTPQVKIMNLSTTSAETNVPVMFRMPNYEQTIYIPTLDPLETKDTTFPAALVSWSGTQAVMCSTMLDGDEIPNDNKMTKMVYAKVKDAKTVGVIQPGTQVDSGVGYVPMVSVKNAGTEAEGFRVRVTIVPDGYVATESVYVLPTQSALVTFDLWTPTRRNYNVFKCSTRLDGDAITNNDAYSFNVRVNVKDAGAWAIITPTGYNVPPGALSPRVTIHNFGNVATQIPAQFDIYRCNPADTPQVYTSSNSAWVNAGASATFTLPDQWTATGGMYKGVLTSILDMDPNPANDTMSEFFFVLEPGHDVGVEAIAAPVGAVDTMPRIPQAAVKNFGSFTENFTATFQIHDSSTGSLAYANTQVVSALTPGEIRVVDFATWGGHHPEDRYYTTSWSELVGDGNPANDTAQGDFMVLANIYDAGVKSIDAPAAQIDSGATVTPMVTVHNYSTSVADFAVRLDIGSGYSNLVALFGVSPGIDTQVVFTSDWSATTRGPVTARCTTLLDYDLYTGNDTLSQVTMVNVHDISAVAIVTPAGGVPPITVTPAARVHNVGTVREPLTATFTIDATPPYDTTKFLTGLPPGVDTVIYFTDWLATVGSYTSKCSLYCATDQVFGNEVVSAPFQVGAVDVSVTEIVAPTGSYDTGTAITPTANVYNVQAIPATFPVRFEISNALDAVVYTEDVTVTDLASHSTRTITFPAWAKPHAPGNYTVRCSTMQAGDEDPTNDVKRGSFTVTTTIFPGGWAQLAPILPGIKNKGIKDGGALATRPAPTPLQQYVYALKGNNRYEFYRYSVATNSWIAQDSIPAFNRNSKKKAVKKGSSLERAGDDKEYATKGNGVLDFWQFDPTKPEGTRWSQMADVPAGGKNCKEGTSSAAVQIGEDNFVYLLKGSGTFEFYRYNVGTGVWDSSLPPAPNGTSGKTFKNGSSITYDGGDTIYALKGSYNEFFAYSVSGKTWTTKDPLPLIGPLGKKKKAKAGAGLAAHSSYVYALKGGNTNEFYRYNTSDHKWYTLADMPALTKRVNGGGALKTMPPDGPLFAFRGNGTFEFWKYTPGTFDQMSVGPTPKEAMGNPSALSARFNLRIAPNPFTSAAAISYSVPQAGNVSLRLYDVAGKLVTTLAQGYTQAGSYTTSVSAAKLASGIYLLKLNCDGNVTTQKLILE